MCVCVCVCVHSGAHMSARGCICASSQPSRLCLLGLFSAGCFRVDHVGGKKVFLLENVQKNGACRRWSVHRPTKSTNHKPCAGREASLCYLRLLWVRTLEGVDLKGWLMGPEPREPEGTWDRHTQIGSWVLGRRHGQVPRGTIQKGRTEAKTRHVQVIKQ